MAKWFCGCPRQPEFTYLGLMTLSELSQLASSGPLPERDWAKGELERRSSFCPACSSKLARESSARAAWAILIGALAALAMLAAWRCL